MHSHVERIRNIQEQSQASTNSRHSLATQLLSHIQDCVGSFHVGKTLHSERKGSDRRREAFSEHTSSFQGVVGGISMTS